MNTVTTRPFHRYMSFFVLAVAVIFFYSCGIKERAYLGPPAPRDQIAVLRLPIRGWASIREIDGSPLPVGVGGSVELPPGKHDITFKYNKGGTGSTYLLTKTVFVEAGKTYEVYAKDDLPVSRERGSQYSGSWRVEILKLVEDKGSGTGVETVVDDSGHYQGTASWDGGTYVGQWKAGRMDGKGISTYTNGDTYEGKFKDGKYNGSGTYTRANGDTYEGEFRNGMLNGNGTCRYSNGDTYEGKFKDGKYNGNGTYTHANGDKYEGEFRNGIYDGSGTYYCRSGNEYSGEWKDNKFVDGEINCMKK